MIIQPWYKIGILLYVLGISIDLINEVLFFLREYREKRTTLEPLELVRFIIIIFTHFSPEGGKPVDRLDKFESGIMITGLLVLLGGIIFRSISETGILIEILAVIIIQAVVTTFILWGAVLVVSPLFLAVVLYVETLYRAVIIVR